MTGREWLALAGWIALCVSGGLLGGLATSADTAWFAALRKPSWNPPSWVFAPVWTTLYVMMGVAAWRVWRRRTRNAALWLFAVQLALNFAWSFIFFSAREIDLAFAEIVVLWAFIAATIIAFSRVDRAAAWLMGPYLAWVSFAAVLNGTIVRLN
jgi:tryptophan-rich sensory protein